MVTFDFTLVPWIARQRRNQARMRQVNTLMIDHYQRYPQTMRWAPAHQRTPVPRTVVTNQDRSAA
jgi:hypothetical protein